MASIDLSLLDISQVETVLELRQQHSPFSLLQRVAEIIEDEDADRLAELRELSCWLLINRCDRRSVNRHLKQQFTVTDKTENTTE